MTTHLRGAALLRDPRYNRTTGFTEKERETLGLVGLLPEAVHDEKTQLQRVLLQIASKPSNLEKYLYLSSLQETNETLFYGLLMSDPAQFLPLVYTPTVGEACLHFSHVIERPRGMFLSISRKGHVREILRNWPERDVRFIVVTSGERILGLGDLGANGMGIPIGKLSLYTACAGVPPQVTMPVLIDCGTNNEALLQDQMYIGLRRPRATEAEVDEFVSEFMETVKQEFPDCCVQFEDWGRFDAFRLLEHYREKTACFNDDIQGTAAVVLAGVLGALRMTGSKLSEQTFLFLGASQAAVGIADLLAQAMVREGLSPERARARTWLFNSKGLVESSRTDLSEFQKGYAHPHAPAKSFAAAIESLRPTAIIGVSTVGKAFDRQVIEAMARVNERPIIFALSNPTANSECTAEEAYEWSDGRAVFASGSPFMPVRYGDQTFVPGQCNNMYVFPAIGLAVYATRARLVTDEMFIAAAHAVADQVSAVNLDVGLIYPPQSGILKTEVRVARHVAEVIFRHGLARVQEPKDLDAFIESHVYKPEYPAIPG